MSFSESGFVYMGRTKKCVILESPVGDVVYCSFRNYWHLTHNPKLKWEVVTRLNPKDNLEYEFIKAYIPSL